MPTLLRLFISDADLAQNLAGDLEWRLLDGPATRSGKAPLDQLPTAKQLEVFLPASTVLKAMPQLPPGGHRQARKLLPFALDSLLLADAAQQHIAFIAQAGQCRVAAVERQLLADLLDRLSNNGLKPRAVWSEADLIPAEGITLLRRPSGWVTVQETAVFWFDDPQGSDCPPLLAQWLGRVDMEVHMVVDPAHASHIVLSSWEAACPNIQLETRDGLVAPISRNAVSLLQGEFAVGANFEVDWSKLRLPGQLAACVLLLWLVVAAGSVLTLRSEEKALRNTINRAFQTAFPSEPLVDARRQLQSRLRQSPTSGSPDGLARLQELAGRLAAASSPPLARLEYHSDLLTLDYRASPDQLTTLSSILGTHYQLSRSSPSAGVERLSAKPR